jgi:hypothetical protein
MRGQSTRLSLQSKSSAVDVMTSDRKIAANRRNSQRSTGPRSVQAKQRIRRNALRHGLRVAALRTPAISTEVERLATAICGEDADPADREQAVIVAESELILLRVRAARVDVIERMLPVSATRKTYGTPSAPVGPHNEPANNLSCLKQLMTLDGYERRALSRRKRALRSMFCTTAQ